MWHFSVWNMTITDFNFDWFCVNCVWMESKWSHVFQFTWKNVTQSYTLENKLNKRANPYQHLLVGFGALEFYIYTYSARSFSDGPSLPSPWIVRLFVKPSVTLCWFLSADCGSPNEFHHGVRGCVQVVPGWQLFELPFLAVFAPVEVEQCSFHS